MNRSAADLLTIARAYALFTSHLSSSSSPSCTEATDIIRAAVRTHGGIHACAIEVAGEYGSHPETAAPRMRWALHVAETTLKRPRRIPRV